MARRKRRLSESERDERRRRDRERLAEATRALLSSEGWRAWLRARATLHAYSKLISGGRVSSPRAKPCGAMTTCPSRTGA